MVCTSLSVHYSVHRTQLLTRTSLKHKILGMLHGTRFSLLYTEKKAKGWITIRAGDKVNVILVLFKVQQLKCNHLGVLYQTPHCGADIKLTVASNSWRH